MNNLINSFTGLVSSAGGIILVLVIAKLAWSGSKKVSLGLVFLCGCVGFYLIRNPAELYTIGKEITVFAKTILTEG
jgi:hypothetical protein